MEGTRGKGEQKCEPEFCESCSDEENKGPKKPQVVLPNIGAPRVATV